jgi:soluble lytic murein transglycosylase-like protein
MGTINEEVTKRIGKGAYPLTSVALAEKWGPVFSIPPDWVLAHITVESSKRPIIMNTGGNAWGMMGIKVTTAEDLVGRIQRRKLDKKNKLIGEVLRNWHGNGEDLYNPDLNVMLGTFYLGAIKKKLDTDNQMLVAAAYNQGPGALQKALEDEELTPAMQSYIKKIQTAKKEQET